jgi:hypothetical protein
MTPKEKAKELVEAMAFSCRECDYESKAKQCALIAVDEIIKFFNPENWGLEMDTAFESIKYWQEVKKEIELL